MYFALPFGTSTLSPNRIKFYNCASPLNISRYLRATSRSETRCFWIRKKGFTWGRAKRTWKREEKVKPFLSGRCASPSPPHLSFTDRLERSGVRAAVCSLRGRKEEVQMRRTRRTRGQKEGQTGRPERGTRGCHGYRRIPASPRCHGDDGIPWSISFSSHRSFRSLAFSASLALAKFRLPRSRGANLLSDDDGRLALSPSLRPSFAEDTGEREVEKERNGRERQPVDVYACAILGFLRYRDSMTFRNSSITYQTRITNATL